MIILPAIDLLEGKAVRLYKGDYTKVTVYDSDPLHTALMMEEAGADWLHLVDLDGARDGKSRNKDTVRHIKDNTRLKIELGGGIRTLSDIDECLECGIDRVIIGTSAVTDPDFAAKAADKYGERIAAGADIKDGYVAIRGWTESSGYTFAGFCKKMEDAGIKTLICTDVSKDGAMQGANRSMYEELCGQRAMRVIASGGVSSMEDITALRDMGLYGAIIGKAYYTGAIELKRAIAAGNGADR